jgi:hypothetical protein
MLRCLTGLSAVLTFVVWTQTVWAAPGGRWCGPPVKTGEASRIAVAGILRKESVWGPPNFGEDPKHDRKETAWFVFLDYPIPVQRNHEFGKTENPIEVRKVQLHATVGQLDDIKSRLEKHAVVIGTLWTAVGPADVTPVTMELIRLEPPTVENPTCRGAPHSRPI